MLLISKFHDYYDSALCMGVDKSIVYRRKSKEVETPTWLKLTTNFPELSYSGYASLFIRKFAYLDKKGKLYKIEPFLIGFCGKIYKGMTVYEDIYNSEHYYCYTKADLIKVLNSKNILYGLNNLKKYDFSVKDSIDMIDNKYISTSTLELNRKTITTINPILKDLKFYKVIDSYTAFQEVSMYISGVIGTGEKETITISDKDMRDAKGFNDESFKNPIRTRYLKNKS